MKPALQETNETVRAAVGAHVRARREALGLTLASLATRLGVNLTTLWRWEEGRTDLRQPRLSSRVRDLARELQTTPLTLLYAPGAGDAPPPMDHVEELLRRVSLARSSSA